MMLIRNSRFVADVTIPDDTHIAAGSQFNKIWRVKNSGDTAWSSGYQLVFANGTPLATRREKALPRLQPGKEGNVSVSLTAPDLPGIYQSCWLCRDADGNFFGEVLLARIVVVAAGEETRRENNYRFVADVTIPAGTQIEMGKEFFKTWRVQNNGRQRWQEGYKLVHVGHEPMSRRRRFGLPATEPDQTTEISLTLTAPDAPGQASSRWRMQTDRGRFFGKLLTLEIEVVTAVEAEPVPLFDPDAWRAPIWAITSIFESGRPEGNPAAYQNVDAGIISYGKHQATLSSGNLFRVMVLYWEQSDSQLSQDLQREYRDRLSRRDASLRDDGRLRDWLIQAATETAMVAAQDNLFERNFYRPVTTVARQEHVTTPLGLACLYDTMIQGGLQTVLTAVHNQLGGKIGDTGLTGQPIDETIFIGAFLNEREARLNRLAATREADGRLADARALRISIFRVEELRQLWQAGNFALRGPFLVRGQVVQGI